MGRLDVRNSRLPSCKDPIGDKLRRGDLKNFGMHVNIILKRISILRLIDKM